MMQTRLQEGRSTLHRVFHQPPLQVRDLLSFQGQNT
jgi:urease accessory protein UreH